MDPLGAPKLRIFEFIFDPFSVQGANFLGLDPFFSIFMDFLIFSSFFHLFLYFFIAFNTISDAVLAYVWRALVGRILA